MAEQEKGRVSSPEKRPSVPVDQMAQEWAASLTVSQVDALIGKCVEARDFANLRMALSLMAVKDPHRAEEWRQVLLFGVQMGIERIVAGQGHE